MRLTSMICFAAALFVLGAPANAQFAVPFGGQGILSAPEAASGAFGAGAANTAATQQQCMQTATGRDGPRGLCLQNAPQAQQRR